MFAVCLLLGAISARAAQACLFFFPFERRTANCERRFAQARSPRCKFERLQRAWSAQAQGVGVNCHQISLALYCGACLIYAHFFNYEVHGSSGRTMGLPHMSLIVKHRKAWFTVGSRSISSSGVEVDLHPYGYYAHQKSDAVYQKVIIYGL